MWSEGFTPGGGGDSLPSRLSFVAGSFAASFSVSRWASIDQFSPVIARILSTLSSSMSMSMALISSTLRGTSSTSSRSTDSYSGRPALRTPASSVFGGEGNLCPGPSAIDTHGRTMAPRFQGKILTLGRRGWAFGRGWARLGSPSQKGLFPETVPSASGRRSAHSEMSRRCSSSGSVATS